MKISFLDVALDLAASRRITRLITKDKIAEPIRENSFVHKHEKVEYLVNCPICVSIYTSAALVISSIVFPRASKPIKYFLALSELQSTLTDVESKIDESNQDYGLGL